MYIPFARSFSTTVPLVSYVDRRAPTRKRPRTNKRADRSKVNSRQIQRLHSKDDNNDTPEESNKPVIVRGFEQDEISDELWENIETGEPPKWIVVKEVSLESSMDGHDAQTEEPRVLLFADMLTSFA